MNRTITLNSRSGISGCLRGLLALAGLALGPVVAPAAVYTWSGAHASNHGWLQEGNYVGGTTGSYVFTDEDTIYYSSLSGAAWTAPVFGGNGTIGTLHFGSETGANPITITRANGAVVTIASGILVDAGAGANTITAGLNLSGETTTFTNNSSNIQVVSLPTGSNTLHINGGAFHFQAQQAGSFTGSVIINENATLRVLNTATLAGTVTVKSGGTLGGRGSIGTTLIESGGLLAPGVPAAPVNAITFSDSLTLSEGSVTLLDLTNTAFDSVNVGGLLAYAGELRLTLADDFSMPGEYTLFNFAVGLQSGSFSSFTLYDSNGKFGELALVDNVWTGEAGGLFYSFDQSTGVLEVSAVPEPGTAALATAGLLGVAALRRRNRHSSILPPVAQTGTK